MSARMHRPKGKGFRMLFGLNALAAVVLAVLLFGIFNYIAYHHHARIDISRSQFYSLSDKTGKLLEGVSNRVDVIVYVQPGRTGYNDIVNLLDQYAARQPNIDLTRIDPDRDLASAEQVAKRYDIDRSNVVVFDHAGKSVVIKEEDIFDLDKAPLERGEVPHKLSFRGEQVFTTALQSVLSDARPKVYFLQGHGEGDPLDFDPQSGFSKCASALENDNIDVEKLTLGAAQSIPDDCDALIIAGPSKSFSSQEIDLIEEYLSANGSLLLMQESMRNVGLTPLLSNWGVSLSDDIVIDKTRTISGRELFITKYHAHPITAGLSGKSSIMYLPAPVEPIMRDPGDGEAADLPKVSVLATSSAKGWAERDWVETPMEFDPEREKGGALSVAVAVERGLQGDPDVKVDSTRIVIFGDSTFVSNAGLAGANMDFFLAAVDWMLEREEMIAIAPKPFEESRIVLTRRQMIMLGAIIVLGLPLLLALIASAVWLFRRS